MQHLLKEKGTYLARGVTFRVCVLNLDVYFEIVVGEIVVKSYIYIYIHICIYIYRERDIIYTYIYI